MKTMLRAIILGIGMFIITTLSVAAAGPFLGNDAEVIYCKGGECGIENGVELVKTGVRDVKTDGTFSGYIQEIVIYLLGFISLIAVIYIIYAGFKILISSGDEETIKKSKNTIIYVIVGILLIWFAWTITIFAIGLGTGGQ